MGLCKPTPQTLHFQNILHRREKHLCIEIDFETLRQTLCLQNIANREGLWDVQFLISMLSLSHDFFKHLYDFIKEHKDVLHLVQLLKDLHRSYTNLLPLFDLSIQLKCILIEIQTFLIIPFNVLDSRQIYLNLTDFWNFLQNLRVFKGVFEQGTCPAHFRLIYQFLI